MKTRRTEAPSASLQKSIERKPPHIVPGTAVFLTSQPDFAPTSLLHNLKHNKVLDEKNVILIIVMMDTPRVSDARAREDNGASRRGSARYLLKFG